MTGEVIKKVVQKLKRPKKEWYFNTTRKTFERFHLLLGLASAFDYSQCKYFHALLYGRNGDMLAWYDHPDREISWQEFQNEVEEKFGRIDNDSCSTLATTDDNPGTGRLIDKFVYQPIGRSIERLFLNLELRYFHPPEKSAGLIKQFLEGSVHFGNLIPDDRLLSHQFSHCWIDDGKGTFKKACVSFFMNISREEKLAKAFHRLWMQASSKNRSLRVEAQKQIWSLIRYENMVFILNAIIDLKSLMWDGCTTTFQHCSPLDPDYKTHFRYVGERWMNNALVAFPTMRMLGISMRDVLETCARENRGFSSLPIYLVLKLLGEELDTYALADHEESEGTEEFAENLYLAVIAFMGFCNEFPYASFPFFLLAQMWYRRGHEEHELQVLLPLWGKNRTESDINALELMIHCLINFINNSTDDYEWNAVHEIEYYIALLNDADKGQGMMSESEVTVSEDYLRKVTEGLVQRGPFSFAMFKDIVTNPLIWEKYYRPERQTEAMDESRLSTSWRYKLIVANPIIWEQYRPERLTEAMDESRLSTSWRYELCAHLDQSLRPSILSFYYIPFSNSFGPEQIEDLFWYTLVPNYQSSRDFAGPVATWFQIQEWLGDLKDNSMALPWDRPGTGLYHAIEWWCSYDIHKEFTPIVQEVRWPEIRTQTFLRSDGETTALSSPCQCGICKRSSCVPDTDKDGTLQPIEELSFPLRTTADFSSQHRCQHNPATESFPLPSRSGLLKRKLEELEPRPQIIPLPRRYRDNTAEDTEPGSSLGPVRKKQRTSQPGVRCQ